LALLVGIDAYPKGVPPLRGCVADVRRAAELLSGRFGFEERDVLVLTDEEATHERIVRAFDEWLLARATPESEVLFRFSGHGSTVPDRGGEREREDSTFLAWDSRRGERRGEYDLIDDELGALVTALATITPRVTVITDACHSGGGVRGTARRQARSVPAGVHPLDEELVAPFWPREVALEGEAPDDERYVHVAACAPYQLAFEHCFDDAAGELAYQGVLSFFLLDGLERCAPGSTWRGVADEAAVRIASRYPNQTVWYEGAVQREAFGADFQPCPVGFLGHTAGERVVLQAGRVHRLREGGLFEVHRNLAESRGAQPLGRVELTEVRARTSIGRWVGAAPGFETTQALWAREVGRPGGSDPLRIHAEAGLMDHLPAELVTPVEEVGLAQVFLRTRGGETSLLDATGHELWRSTEPTTRALWDLADALRSELRWRSLFTLADEPGDLKLEARFELPSQSERIRYPGGGVARLWSEEGAARGELHATGGPSASEYHLVTLRIRNLEAEPLHVTVLSLPESRTHHLEQSVEMIWPSMGRTRDNGIPAGGEELVPVGLVHPERWALDRPLRDRYLVIALREWADFTPFLTGLKRGGDPPPRHLPAPLREALTFSATRGSGGEPVQERSWGVLAVDLLIHPGEGR